MRIPVSYIVMVAIAIGTIFWVRSEAKQIQAAANTQAQEQYARDIESYKENVGKIKGAKRATQRGWRFLKSNDAVRAEIVLQRAVQLDKNYRDAAFYLGYAQLKELEGAANHLSAQDQKSRLEEARKALLTAQRIDPLHPLTSKLLGIVYEKLGDDKEAGVWYARYKELSKS